MTARVSSSSWRTFFSKIIPTRKRTIAIISAIAIMIIFSSIAVFSSKESFKELVRKDHKGQNDRF